MVTGSSQACSKYPLGVSSQSLDLFFECYTPTTDQGGPSSCCHVRTTQALPRSSWLDQWTPPKPKQSSQDPVFQKIRGVVQKVSQSDSASLSDACKFESSTKGIFCHMHGETKKVELQKNESGIQREVTARTTWGRDRIQPQSSTQTLDSSSKLALGQQRQMNVVWANTSIHHGK